MRLFQCPSCAQLIFFENTACVRCGCQLGFVPETGSMVAAGAPGAPRHCQGGDPDCNWLVADGDQEQRCRACRSTIDHPPADGSQDAQRWGRLEQAKRRLLHTLLHLHLPLDGLTFSFPASGITGHAEGHITVVLPEADDAEREKRRTDLGEPYRTLIGHLRHESGHHFWDVLVSHAPCLDEVRACFGDERQDYAEALAAHYANGPQPGWEATHVSSYATSHPWEDWAETWAHYLHLVDALEIAAAYGLSLHPQVADKPVKDATVHVDLEHTQPDSFDGLLDAWFPLTYFANSLNRSIGLQDWYPFVLGPAVVAKLRLIHRIIEAGPTATAQEAPSAAGGSRDH